MSQDSLQTSAPFAQGPEAPAVSASCGCEQPGAVTASAAETAAAGPRRVYAIGTLGYDFGTEARRDSFKQLMPAVAIDQTLVPANPYDARQMVRHLERHPAEGRALIWTLNLELTPIYALEATGPFGHEVYKAFQELLAGEVAAPTEGAYVERVSVPGRLTDRKVRLFSGQWVPVVELEHSRGLYGWQVNELIGVAMAAAARNHKDPNNSNGERMLRGFLQRIYYDLRNLGVVSRDRALNFAATNGFQAAETFRQAVAEGMELDSINVERSPFCRLDSDCWDVKLVFFDPENTRRARRVYRFTIDVSDVVPVTLGEVRSWATSA